MTDLDVLHENTMNVAWIALVMPWLHRPANDRFFPHLQLEMSIK